MRISIVCGYYYPQNTPRAFRAAELAEELVRRGHEVHVYTITGNSDYSDYKLSTGVSVVYLGCSKLGMTCTQGVTQVPFLSKVICKVFGRMLFLPYIEMIRLIKKKISDICEETDLIISIAHPHSVHWGVAFAKKKVEHFPIWISDCGDPFMGDPFEKYPFYFKYIEKNWCKETDYITIPIEEGIESYYPEFRDKIRIIPQGFKLNELPVEYKKNQVPTFAYAGAFYFNQRDPRKFLDYLRTLDKPFKFYIYSGKNAKNLLSSYCQAFGDKLVFVDSIPRKQLLLELARMDFLVNILNIGGVQQPSKLIDYSIARRPVINISSNCTKEEQDVFGEFVENNYANAAKLPSLEQYNITNVVDLFLCLANN